MRLSIIEFVPRVEFDIIRTAQLEPLLPPAVQSPYSKWIDFLFGPMLRVIGFFYRTYKANRARVAEIKSKPKVAGVIRFLAIAFLLGWILIWLFASDASRSRLTDEFRRSLDGFGTMFGR